MFCEQLPILYRRQAELGQKGSNLRVAVPKTAALPLGYAPETSQCITRKEGVEPPSLSLKHRILTAVLLSRGAFLSAPGLEPGTNGLKGRCSTIELRARVLSRGIEHLLLP